MTKKNVVLIGDHNSGKKIFMSRLINSFSMDSWTNINMKVTKNVMYDIKNIYDATDIRILTSRRPIENECGESNTYDINVSVLLLDDIDEYDFSKVSAILCFSDGLTESQLKMFGKIRNKVKFGMPLAFLIPYHADAMIKCMYNNFKVINWHCSTGASVPASRYMKIVTDLLDSRTKEFYL